MTFFIFFIFSSFVSFENLPADSGFADCLSLGLLVARKWIERMKDKDNMMDILFILKAITLVTKNVHFTLYMV